MWAAEFEFLIVLKHVDLEFCLSFILKHEVAVIPTFA